MKTYYKLTIDETGRDSLKEPSRMFNQITEFFKTREDADTYLADRYGHMPNGKNKVYVDVEDGKAVPIGFTYSYWNSDISHNSPKWYQTDWIVITKVTEEYL